MTEVKQGLIDMGLGQAILLASCLGGILFGMGFSLIFSAWCFAKALRIAEADEILSLGGGAAVTLVLMIVVGVSISRMMR